MNQITITTERLIIRPVDISDTAAVHEYASDKSITMMMFLPNENIDETMSFVEYAAGEWKKEEPHDREFVMVYNGKIIGGINLESTEPSGNYEIGWTLYVIIDVSERKKNLWYNKNYHNITERSFICTTARN